MSVASNWWEHFFEGLSVTLWLQALTPEHTANEAVTIARLLHAAPGAELLDVPCGGGRLSLALAERGYRLTGPDQAVPLKWQAHTCEQQLPEPVTSADSRFKFRESLGTPSGLPPFTSPTM